MTEQKKIDLIIISEFKSKNSNKELFTFIWNSLEDTKNCISITNYLDTNGERIKKKYINFIYELGQKKINNNSIIEHSQIYDYYNLWWMSLLSEKSHYKSKKVKDTLKIIALEEMLTSYSPKKIIINFSDKDILNSISELCKNLKIELEINKTKTLKFKKNVKRIIYDKLPFIIRGFFLYIQYFKSNLFSRKRENSSFFSSEKKITFFSYLIHVNKEDIRGNIFRSGQWGPIPKLLSDLKINSNWIHHFIPNVSIPSKNVALNYLNGLNKDKEKNGFHQLLNDNLSFSILFKVFINYLKTIIKFSVIKKIKKNSRFNGSQINFWHLIKDDLLDSFFGYTAVQNLFWIELFDRLLKTMPHQEKGFYTQEHQGWEKALIVAWKKYNHGKLHGMNNGYIRFWDTRYFEDSRALDVTNKYKNPIPDYIVLTDQTALSYYLDYGFTLKNIIKAETIRYFELINKINKQKKTNVVNSSKLKILILGDYIFDITHKMLQSLESLNKDKYDCEIKSHPACVIDTANYKNLKIKDRTKDNLGEIISEFDLVFAPSATFAVFEAYLANINIIIFLDQDELNMSPLRSFENVNFVYDQKTLMTLLENKEFKKKALNNKSIFWHDKNLELWNKILD